MKKSELIILFLGITAICSAREYKDTLISIDGYDSFILTYTIDVNDNNGVIEFHNVIKKQIGGNKRKGKEYPIKDVDVVFFDKVGGYDDGIKFIGLEPEAFSVPSNLTYSKSKSGYFFLKDKPPLHFLIKGNDTVTLSIPLYFAHYEKKSEYKLISKFEHFQVSFSRKIKTSQPVVKNEIALEPVTSTYEIEANNEYAIEVQELIGRFEEQLQEEYELPFSRTLEELREELKEYKKCCDDKELKNKIENCLEQYDDKEKIIKEKNSLDAQKERERAEEIVRLEKEREQARQDSLAFVQQQKAEEEKKRNIWMIVGGVIFAVVCFVGNQVLQHFRNIRNQRSMFEMQQDIARRAEYEAKRHAYNYTRNKTNEMVNRARRNTQKIVNNKTRQSGGNKSKNFSI